jgi:hypothetical protein
MAGGSDTTMVIYDLEENSGIRNHDFPKPKSDVLLSYGYEMIWDIIRKYDVHKDIHHMIVP